MLQRNKPQLFDAIAFGMRHRLDKARAGREWIDLHGIDEVAAHRLDARPCSRDAVLFGSFASGGALAPGPGFN